MSLARQLFNDMRPLYRLLEEGFNQPAAFAVSPSRHSFLEDPFFQPSNTMRLALDVTEQGNNYIVEAEMPGVKKENLEVKIGDAGRSVTIEGKTFRKTLGDSRDASTAPDTSSSSEATGGQGTGMGYIALITEKNTNNIHRLYSCD